jgi:hypothetical protein
MSTEKLDALTSDVLLQHLAIESSDTPGDSRAPAQATQWPTSTRRHR